MDFEGSVCKGITATWFAAYPSRACECYIGERKLHWIVFDKLYLAQILSLKVVSSTKITIFGTVSDRGVIFGTVYDKDRYIWHSIWQGLLYLAHSLTNAVIFGSVSDKGCYIWNYLWQRLIYLTLLMTKYVIFGSISDKGWYIWHTFL